jgi:hypothetical protein
LNASSLSTGSLTSNKTSGSFTILANSSKPVQVKSNSVTYSGTTYKYAIDLKGGADGVKPTYRAIQFSASSGETITVIVNANADRTFQLSNGSKVVKETTIGSTVTAVSYTATASGTYYVYSKSSAMNVYDIKISGGSSSSSSSGSSSSGSSSSSSSSSGSAISFKPSSLSTGSVTSNTTYSSFQVLASSDKPVAIVNSSLTYNSNNYTKALDLKGGFSGNKPTYRAVKFDAASGATISVVATAGASRTLQLSDGSSILKKVTVGTSATLLSYTTTKSGTYYVYSSGSAISIYEVYVSAGGSSSGSSSSSSGSSSSGSSSSTTTNATFKADSLSTGTLTSNKTSGSFTILASSAKPVAVKANQVTYSGTTYKNALDLKGGADGVKATYRAVSISVKKDSTITVVANANSARTLIISNGSKSVKEASIGTSVSATTYKADADATYYIYSKSSALNIYEISVK